jgi:hypothetical protein
MQHRCGIEQMQRTLVILTALTLTACGQEPDMAMHSRQRQVAPGAPVTENERVTVERIGIFRDKLAYGDRRGVYVIRDKATGREFIGVSGVGIAETGTHQSGKISIQDER